jgi:hypothetical protein
MDLLHKILQVDKRICFASKDEAMEMLRMCERLGILWCAGEKATEYIPRDNESYIYLDYSGCLCCGGLKYMHFGDSVPRVDWYQMLPILKGET